MIAKVREYIARFIARHVIGDEPADAPPSRLDERDAWRWSK